MAETPKTDPEASDEIRPCVPLPTPAGGRPHALPMRIASFPYYSTPATEDLTPSPSHPHGLRALAGPVPGSPASQARLCTVRCPQSEASDDLCDADAISRATWRFERSTAGERLEGACPIGGCRLTVGGSALCSTLRGEAGLVDLCS